MIDPNQRMQWDLGVDSVVKMDEKNELHIYYSGSDELPSSRSSSQLLEKVRYEYVSEDDVFVIHEAVNSPQIGQYERIWILQEIMRDGKSSLKVTFLTEVTAKSRKL